MGKLKDYTIWHKNTYGEWPKDSDEMDPDAYLASKESDKKEVARWDSKDLENPEIVKELKLYSPGAQLIADIKNEALSIDDINWRDFEELVAELLRQQGWGIELGTGTKDGGIDIMAEKDLDGVGKIRTLWQAKHYSIDRKVGLKEIRELHSVVVENRVTKGIMVTSTHLTRGAIERIERDRYQLGHNQRPVVLKWIEDAS